MHIEALLQSAQPSIQAQIKENIKARVTGLCAENSLVTGEFPAQMASNAEIVSIWWRHHDRACLNNDNSALLVHKQHTAQW